MRNILYIYITLSSTLILCAILDLRLLAPTKTVVDITTDDECPWPFVEGIIRGFSSPSSVSSSSSIGICYKEKKKK